MDVRIRLLGRPEIEHDGRAAAPPRGRKAWAVLAYVVLAERSVSRQHLAGLLFADAADPLGALRWTLAELRRTLGSADALRGDPVVLGVDRMCLDVSMVAAGDRDAVLAVRGDLLEGLHLDGCAVFESWLVVEQYRWSSTVEAQLRQAAFSSLAAGDPEGAVAFASAAVARNVLDESNHELLVRSLAAAGDVEGALRQVAVCEDVLARELGATVSPALHLAARRSDVTEPVTAGDAAEIETLIEAGRAAVGAGAVDAGLDCLRRAVAKAAHVEDGSMRAVALLALGSALVHSVRGRDGEGAVVLHEALRAAEAVGDDRTTASACRELGFVDVQAGRRTTATVWLERAMAHAGGDDRSRAAILGVQGMNASDMGDYPVATAALEESVRCARRCGDARQEAWSLSILARVHLLRGEHAQGAVLIERSLSIVQEQRWMAFLPWPQAIRAELEVGSGRLGDGVAQLDRAFALSCQLGDPCWEGMTARLLGLLCAQRGDLTAASTWLDEGRRRSGAVTDPYQWVRAYVLDAMVEVAIAAGDLARAGSLTEQLSVLAARCELREMVARALVHQWRLGDAKALDAARLLADRIDNPGLRRALDDAAREISR
ncbi:MAG: hypothetical protein JWM34_867 [Ilumatobacteraceae bacterium]|nr:hypothetical protein [Ilumatobacteraceae bacterium]